MNISDFFKSIFCKHEELLLIRNIYADEIIISNWKRSICKCKKCNKYFYNKELYISNITN